MARHKTHDRSVDCIWTGRLSRVASISRCTRRLFAGRGGMTGPETFERVYALSVSRPVYFWRFANSWRAPPLLATPCPSDVIPWNHRGGVFSCVRINRQGELIVRSPRPSSRLPCRRIARMRNKRANYKVRIMYSLSLLKIPPSKLCNSLLLFSF